MKLSIKQAYRILGLSNGTSKDLVKKKYRRLVKLYHPDLNPSPEARLKFIRIQHAYDKIMDAHPDLLKKRTAHSAKKKNSTKTHYKTNDYRESEEKIRQEKVKKARERFQSQQERNAKEEKRYFEFLTGPKRWPMFKLISYCSIVLGVILLIEPAFPSHFKYKRVAHVPDNAYNGIKIGDISKISFTDGTDAYIAEITLHEVLIQEPVLIEYRWFSHTPISAELMISHPDIKKKCDWNLGALFPWLSFILLLPIIPLKWQFQSFHFSILYHFVYYVNSSILIIYLLGEKRFVHIVTLGLL